MKIFLDETGCREQLFPFTHTRHVADIRLGILSIREKWEKLTGATISTSIEGSDGSDLVIKSNLIPNLANFESILKPGNAGPTARLLEHPWQLFQWNDEAIRQDFELITRNRKSQSLHKSNHCDDPGQVFIEEGAVATHSLLNTSNGPIYIGKNALVMEGNLLRGPIALCDGAVLKMGSKIYGATTLGPYSVGGGEIKNSILFGYSNKAHDGYLGDSVIGEWCNLGAGTCNSNLKNTAGEIKYFLGAGMEALPAGNKGGVLMGDYSRTAINTSFNTATVVGVCCNIFGDHSPGKYTANFSWGHERYELEKAIKDIGNWKRMKGMDITEKEISMLKILYHLNT